MQFFAGIINSVLLKPVLRPLFRVLSGLIAIPIFRFIIRHVFRRQMSSELEKDLETWFRGAVILLAATANLEDALFGWLPWHHNDEPWFTMLFRLILAIGVIEYMPDQEIFGLLHRAPPKFEYTSKRGWSDAWKRRGEFLRGLGILHLRRSSPVFVIMTVIFGAASGERDFVVGWVCYGLAILQYLIIGIITDGDRIRGILQQFDRNAAALRQELEHPAHSP